MHQLAVMRPYIEKHLQELHEKNQDEDLIMKQHNLHFTTWLKYLNLPVGETEEEKMIHLLTSGPHSLVKSGQAYDIMDAHSIPRQRTVGVSAKIVL
jgi:hypothetical protein